MNARDDLKLEIDIVWEDDGWPDRAMCENIAFDAARLAYSGAISEAAIKARGNAAEVSLVFAADDYVKELNLNWRGMDKSTNVLSFPALDDLALSGAPRLLGDVVLARQTVVAEAAEQGKPVVHHVGHLVCHGMLHLLGYDHLTDTDAKDMESLETALLAQLKIPDPYANE